MAEGALVQVGDVFPCGGMRQQDAEPEFGHLGRVRGGGRGGLELDLFYLVCVMSSFILFFYFFNLIIYLCICSCFYLFI
jgi:hypothetical protein